MRAGFRLGNGEETPASFLNGILCRFELALGLHIVELELLHAVLLLRLMVECLKQLEV